MENVNERPICHRAEDLVAYLYGEASETDARDFAAHVERCDACRAELAIFRQVHESILIWRNEALGSAFNPAPQAVASLTEAKSNATQFVQHARRLSAFAALREFFSVSPLWLRGATAFAALLLCVLALFAIFRSLNRPAEVAKIPTEEKRYTATELKSEIAKQVNDITRTQIENGSVKAGTVHRNSVSRESASNRIPSRSQRAPVLTRAEREQLAADLRLIPGRDDVAPFVLTDEPNQ